MKQTKTLELAQTALLSALIVLLAFVPYIGYIKLPDTGNTKPLLSTFR